MPAGGLVDQRISNTPGKHMPTKTRRRKSRSVAAKALELAVAAPQVVAHRMARMALAGPSPSKRDQREFQKMFSEKNSAFAEAWLGMASETLRANQAIAASLFASIFTLRPPKPAWFAKTSASLQDSASVVIDKGLTPLHRKAVANARRLAKLKRR